MGSISRSKMNREPPKNVYGNNRLRKIIPAADQIPRHQSAHQQHNSTLSNSNVKNVNKPQDFKAERTLHFNKSQSKYQKHFEPSVPNKTLAPKRLNEGSDVKNFLLDLKNPSQHGELGIPLAHNYVRRKVSSDVQPLQPTGKKPRKNVDYSKQQSSLGVNHDRLNSNSETPTWIPFQDSPKHLPKVRNELSCTDFFLGVKATLADTFEEIVKDNTKFETAPSRAKQVLLQKLRSSVKRYQEQAVVEDHLTTDDMDELTSESEYSIYLGESSVEKTPQLFNKTTPNFGATAKTSITAAGRFKSHSREFLSRFQGGMSSNSIDRLTPDTVSSKGTSVEVLNRNLSLNVNRYHDYAEEKAESFDPCLPPMFDRDKVPYYPQYYSSSSHLQDN